MASEDSDQLSSGLLTVHRFRDFGNRDQSVARTMSPAIDQFHAPDELLEVAVLERSHVMLLEERNDRRDQVRPSSHHVAVQVFAVVIPPPIGDDTSHSEKRFELVETRDALRALRNRKLVSHLVAGSVASAPRPIRLPDEADGEAALSVYKTYNPAELNQPFLLVFCTRHIVTVSPTWDGTRSAGFSGFPAYSQMRTAQLPARGAAFYLRTVPSVTPQKVNLLGGPLISGGLSWSPMSADYLIPPPL